MNDNTLNPDAPATLGATRWFYSTISPKPVERLFDNS